MNKLRNGLATSLAWLLVMQPWMTATATAPDPGPASKAAAATPRTAEPRELTGFLDDRIAEYRAARDADRKAGYGEDGEPAVRPPLADLPVIDNALSTRMAQRGTSDEPLRVLIHLDYLPHEVVLRDTLKAHEADIERLESDRRALLAPAAARRDRTVARDADNYADNVKHDPEYRAALRELSERNEALSLKISTQVTNELRELIDAYQAPVRTAIEKLGGNVEFATIAGNTIVATLPPSAIDALAKQAGVMRIVEDGIIEGHLNVADTSTMVDPADTGMTGLWDSGNTGSVYDPATIDSGVDQNHPALKNSASRSNWCSWYLVAAAGSANFDDIYSCDDMQGHGTHVQGIVGSYGSSGYSTHKGMAHGVEKIVNLKAGWLNASNGRASMYWSDKYMLVDRAINNTAQLGGPTAFADDVDGFNLSYGGETTLDDTDGGRFWDSVVSSIADTPVTISAGNSGPSNANFNDPAVSYNAIVVANANDRGTTSRDDDIIRSSSTVGPTANNRKKPDIAAPGTSISAPRHNWEGGNTDFVNKTGTSMAAPMVLGVLMDLMDAGLLDEKALKAVLINTAQKNLPGMNIESDSDGWDPQIGWGLMNAYAAYHHRFDYFLDSVAPNGTAGDYQLYKGVMRDEGATGEGRDKATMVWNRHATYSPGSDPSTYYGLVDLNLRLYDENTEVLIDSDLDYNDNVHQVRVGAGAGDTDVIINAYAWSSNFSHGGATQSFALATEENFERVDLPTQFQGIAVWPGSVEPNETFDIRFWLRNDSEIASHDNVFNLQLPAGWALIAGTDTQNVGSAAAGGLTAQVTYTVRAPSTPVGAQTVVVKHSHNSYNEPYGDFNWNINLTVEYDVTPPNPSPMSFSTAPHDLSTDSISMTAQIASDVDHNPVEYYLQWIDNPTGGFGMSSSGWQSSRTFVDDGLYTNHQYCYRAWARDSSISQNLTDPSPTVCTYTAQETPAGVAVGAVSTTSIQVASTLTPPNLALDSSGLKFSNTTHGTNSGWQQNNNHWTSAGLTPAKSYAFVAQARNGDGDLTAFSSTRTVHTLANIPAVDVLHTVSSSEIKVALNPNGNSNEAEYFIQNTTNGTDSGWVSDTSVSFDGLACDTFYNFQAKARNGDGIETIIVPLGLQSTAECAADTDGDGVTDDDDNCTLVPNPTQLDTDGDGIGNHCDADINQDCAVNFGDLALLKAGFFPVNDPNADFTGDSLVNFADLAFMKTVFGQPPGPGAPGNLCDAP